MAFVLERTRRGRSERTSVQGSVLRVGRGTHAELRLDDPGVDLEHAMIEHRPSGDFTLLDLGSVTGTYLNGEPARQARLADGDLIDLGAHQIRIRLDTAGTLELQIMLREEAVEGSEAAARQTPSSPAREAPVVDYLRAYRLERRWLGKGMWAAALCALTVAALLIASRHPVGFAPGELVPKHQTATGDSCAACHRPWRQVADQGCTSAGCHPGIGDHQARATTQHLGCVDCHVEHRGVGPLRLVAAESCVDCHEDLASAAPGTRFASQITGFEAATHPELSIRTASGQRRPLPMARSGDPGRLRNFSHADHLGQGYAGRNEKLTCSDCHPTDEHGEIVPLTFERRCRDCHSMRFDNRFEDENADMAPHGESIREMFESLSGRYASRHDLLERLSAQERRRLLGQPTRERKLHELARMNAETVVRNECAKCHRTIPSIVPETSAAIDLLTLEIEPPNIPRPWLPHAEFRHRPHLELATCEECHGGAASSNETADVLLPELASCQACHRGRQPSEDGAVQLAGTDCAGCHTYHPKPAERASMAERQG